MTKELGTHNTSDWISRKRKQGQGTGGEGLGRGESGAKMGEVDPETLLEWLQVGSLCIICYEVVFS